MRRIIAAIKEVFAQTAGSVNTLFCLPVILAGLATRYQILKRAQVIVVMAYPSGFGHTVLGPDVTRRLFQGCSCVFIVLSQNANHNWKISTIWPDIDVIFLRSKLSFHIQSMTGRPKELCLKVINRVIRILANPQVLLISPDVRDLYKRIPIPDTLRSSIESHLRHNSHKSLLGYFQLRQKVAVPRVRLPSKWRDEIQGRLRQVVPFSSPRHCGLYLRQKGKNSTDITESRRVGSSIEDYLPAVRLLNRAGYQVLLTGDVSLNLSLYREFGGMLVDPDCLGVNKQLFDIYVATEVDIFIGEAGGGIFLPGVNNIPCLILNAFPYLFGMPNSWIYYKTVRDQTGKLVHYTKLFSNYPEDYELTGMTVHCNSAEEIHEAVSYFIEDVSRAGEPDPNAHIMSQVPDYTWIKQANARLSPAFLRLFEHES